MNNNLTVYCLAGLGLNSSIFKRLDLSAKEIHYIEWLEPEPDESLTAYATRMSQGIQLNQAPLVLIGHSFGGVIMQEISKQIPTAHIILISSIKAKKEKSTWMNRWMRVFPVNKLLTQKIVLQSFKSWGKAHGYDTPEAQEIFLQAAAQHSTYYFRWATSAIFAWESIGVVTPITHLHGTKDKTFPFKRVLQPVVAVEEGSHFMVFNKATLITQLINHTLAEISEELKSQS